MIFPLIQDSSLPSRGLSDHNRSDAGLSLTLPQVVLQLCGCSEDDCHNWGRMRTVTNYKVCIVGKGRDWLQGDCVINDSLN